MGQERLELSILSAAASKTAVYPIPPLAHISLLGIPYVIRTHTLQILSLLPLPVGLMGHLIWREIKESNPHRLLTSGDGFQDRLSPRTL